MKKFFRALLLLGACSTVVTAPVMAQTAADTAANGNFLNSNCTCQSVPVGIGNAVTMPKSIWMFSYRFMNSRMNGNLSGNETVSDEQIYSLDYSMAPRDMNMQMHMLMGMYGITPKITVMAMLNYSVMKMKMDAFSSGHVHGGGTADAPQIRHISSSSSLSDSKVSVIYALVNNRYHHLNIGMGLSIPTGNIYYIGGKGDMYEGLRENYMMKLGTGTWDVNPSVAYLRLLSKVMLGVQAGYLLHTGYNSLGYKTGDEVSLNLWTAYRWARWGSASLRMAATSGGEIKGADAQLNVLMEPASSPLNYGGQRILASAGLNLTVPKGTFKNTTLSVEFGMPVYQNVNGIQTGLQYSAGIGLDYMF